MRIIEDFVLYSGSTYVRRNTMHCTGFKSGQEETPRIQLEQTRRMFDQAKFRPAPGFLLIGEDGSAYEITQVEFSPVRPKVACFETRRVENPFMQKSAS